jgi:hypothetical protein
MIIFSFGPFQDGSARGGPTFGQILICVEPKFNQILIRLSLIFRGPGVPRQNSVQKPNLRRVKPAIHIDLPCVCTIIPALAMDDQDTELRNPFPSPPSHYTRYTSHNLGLLTLLRNRAQDPYHEDQHQILPDQPDVPDWPLVQLEKPRIDWILDEPDAYYDVYGDRWFVWNNARPMYPTLCPLA